MFDLDAQISKKRDLFIQELIEFCSIPSISAQGIGLVDCANKAQDMLERRGFRVVDIRPTDSTDAPILLGTLPGRTDKTLLFYGHYDVAPAEPLSEWHSDPFQPVIRGDRLIGRGVADHKSSILERLQAIDILLEDGPLPVGIKFLIEGEEEIGSPNLDSAVSNHMSLLKADAGLYVGGFRTQDNQIQIRLGKKGNLAVELSVRCLPHDLPSYKAATHPNAGWRLVRALSSLIDNDNHIKLEHFYDDVLEPSDEWKEMLIESRTQQLESAHTEDQRNQIFATYAELFKEAFSPTMNLCGFSAGYTGKGFKAVLPSEAFARIEFQLMPNQTTDSVILKLKNHLAKHGFSDVELSIINALEYGVTSKNEHIVDVVSKTAKEVYAQEPLFIPISGGAGPWQILSKLGCPIVSEPGVAYSGSNFHGPNENIRMSDYLIGIKHIAKIISDF